MYLMLPGRPELVGTYGVDLMTLFGCGCVDSGSLQDVADLGFGCVGAMFPPGSSKCRALVQRVSRHFLEMC